MNYHGGDIYKYDKEIIDFSSNINPFGVPQSLKVSLMDNLEVFSRYPDISYKKVRDAIAKYLCIGDINHIVVGNGAVEIIYKVVSASNVNEIIIPCPTFSEYKRAAKVNNKPYKEIVAFREDGSLNLNSIYENITSNSLMVLCNPNNPTGTLLDPALITSLAQRLKEKESWLLVDESFIEFSQQYPLTSVVPKLIQHPNIIVIRAATKFFGIPGVRLGYGVVGDSRLAASVKEKMEPWSVNSLAELAGLQVFKDKQYIAKSRLWVEEERKYLFNQLKLIKGVAVVPSEANFLLLKSKKLTAFQIKENLLKKKILIRVPQGFTGLTKYHFRVAVKDREANQQLIKALKEVLM
ncbi:histidinol-phosphate transaminase [Proteinivorax tanatarense]|uniref:Histidinol-phosphate transaminase n=1 Tax=Proteinivorax tanatarense TaxID=1260629 RepID=A0AAU7VJ86_9FIRM